jgi:hypothetical protein
MKTYGGVEVYLHTFLTSALDGDESSTSQPRPLYPCGGPLVPIGQEDGERREEYINVLVGKRQLTTKSRWEVLLKCILRKWFVKT